MIWIVISAVLLICLICVLVNTNKKVSNLNEEVLKVKNTKIEEFSEETRKECERLKQEEKDKFEEFKELQKIRREDIDRLLKEKEKRYNEVNQDLDVYRYKRIEDINKEMAAQRATNLEVIKHETEKVKQDYLDKYNKLVEEKDKEIVLIDEEIGKIKEELEEERVKRAAINEEILRQRKLQEKEDFFRIQLPEVDKPDIEILRATAPRLQHPEAINKIIWTNYYQKPLAELRKRLLPDGDYSGIYKITRIKTGEIYIGQTTSIDKRWQNHVKSALGVGTLTSSQLHRIMASDGPENFTFEVIEKTDKDKLKERESYYINFYDSKNYGLNTIKGQANE